MANIVEMPVEEVKPYTKNPRIIADAVDKVAESIKEFGFRQPILVDENNEIIAGHTRLAAAKKLGLKTVPVIKYTDLTPKQVKALRLADNKVAEYSYWDMEGLLDEMDDLLKGTDLANEKFDFSALGFDMGAFTSGGDAEDDTFTEEMEDPENDVWNTRYGEGASIHFTSSLTYPAEFKSRYNAYIMRKGNREALLKVIMDYINEQIKEQGIDVDAEDGR